MPDYPNPDASESPLSLKRLTAAFAQMLGSSQPAPGAADATEQAAENLSGQVSPQPHDPCEISPRSIVEGVLFVGASEGKPASAEQLAAAMRDVSPEEVMQAVAELNAMYERDAAPYHITSERGGYRLTLRDDMQRMRDKFHGRIKETKLSPAAMEVLSIIAYRQPVTIDDVEHLRGARSGALLSSLVRRGLVRLDRVEQDAAGKPNSAAATQNRSAEAVPSVQAAPSVRTAQYQTTDRFLRLFGLGHINQLPRAAEMDD